MVQIKKILAAIDLSDYSQAVLDHALLQARCLGAELVVANVLNHRDIEAVRYYASVSPESISVDDYIERQKEFRRGRIEELIQSCGGDPKTIQILFKVGIPFDELIQLVKEEDIDLVVMGPKGQTNLPSLLFGTNAEKVFRHCPVPLLSIRGNGREDLRRQWLLRHRS